MENKENKIFGETVVYEGKRYTQNGKRHEGEVIHLDSLEATNNGLLMTFHKGNVTFTPSPYMPTPLGIFEWVDHDFRVIEKREEDTISFLYPVYE